MKISDSSPRERSLPAGLQTVPRFRAAKASALLPGCKSTKEAKALQCAASSVVHGPPFQ